MKSKPSQFQQSLALDNLISYHFQEISNIKFLIYKYFSLNLLHKYVYIYRNNYINSITPTIANNLNVGSSISKKHYHT